MWLEPWWAGTGHTHMCDRLLFPCSLGSVVGNSVGGLIDTSSGTCFFHYSKCVCYVSGRRKIVQSRVNLTYVLKLTPTQPPAQCLCRVAAFYSKWGSLGDVTPPWLLLYHGNRKGKYPLLIPREDLEYLEISSQGLHSNNSSMSPINHIPKIFSKIPTPAAICL